MGASLQKRSGRSDGVSVPPGFLAAYPGYRGTGVLDGVRAAEFGYLDAGGHVYLDYAGAGLAAGGLVAGHAGRVGGGCFGNPHSQNPASVASTRLVERARRAVLGFFNAPPEEYAVIFTANATGACRLVGEAYPFGPGTGLVLTADNHNSVNGIREFARARRAGTRYVPFGPVGLRVGGDAVARALTRPGRWRPGRGRRGLFAYPAQSNFSGVQHPLGWVEAAHERGFDVLLDAAAFVPSNRLDLSVVKPDFVPVSWYKVLGYPTGVGCLIARWQALGRLRRPWFAGGSVTVAGVQAAWHAPAAREAAFEDGTVSFLQIPDVEAGLAWIGGIGMDVIHQRVTCLAGWLLDRLGGLRHGNGTPMARLYGPAGTDGRGGTIAFSLLDPRGHIIDERAVARDTATAGICIRTGCFCNPGAGEGAFKLTKADWRRAIRGRARTMDQYVDLLGLPSAGALRASVGLASNVADVERFLAFVETTYQDRVIGTAGLPSREGC